MTSGLDGLVDQRCFGAAAEKDHAGGGPIGGDLPGGVDAVELGHAQVEDGDIGLELARQADGGAAVAGLGHHLEAALFLQDAPQSRAHDLVIAGQ